MIDVESLRPTADEMLSGLSAGEAMKRRIILQADATERIACVAEEMLSGMHAGAALRHRILVRYERRRNAARAKAEASRSRNARLRPAAGMAFALALMIGLGVFFADGHDVTLPDKGLSSFASGTLTQTGVPQFVSLFAGESANPPLVSINGRYYRMMTSPSAVPESLLDGTLAEVQTYMAEPSLGATAGIFSNIAQTGAQVYAIAGLSSKTAVAVEVDGAIRLFQRVGYAGSTTLGTELFQDTLDVQGQVAALELSGVGVITDEEVANEVLVYMLTEFATFAGSDMPNAEQALTIYLQNGLTLQLLVEDGVFYGCGAWACPEFEEAFRAEMDT